MLVYFYFIYYLLFAVRYCTKCYKNYKIILYLKRKGIYYLQFVIVPNVFVLFLSYCMLNSFFNYLQLLCLKQQQQWSARYFGATTNCNEHVRADF